MDQYTEAIRRIAESHYLELQHATRRARSCASSSARSSRDATSHHTSTKATGRRQPSYDVRCSVPATDEHSAPQARLAPELRRWAQPRVGGPYPSSTAIHATAPDQRLQPPPRCCSHPAYARRQTTRPLENGCAHVGDAIEDVCIAPPTAALRMPVLTQTQVSRIGVVRVAALATGGPSGALARPLRLRLARTRRESGHLGSASETAAMPKHLSYRCLLIALDA